MDDQIKQQWVEQNLKWVCRDRPRLKIRPEHCEARKSIIRKAYYSETMMFHECSGCPGPLPNNGDAAPVLNVLPQRVVPPMCFRNTPPPRVLPHRCKCGETDPEAFYPGEKSTCKVCRRKEHQAYRRKKQGVVKLTCPSCKRSRKVGILYAQHRQSIGELLCRRCAAREVAERVKV